MSIADDPQKILIIDDDDDLRYSLKRVLSGKHYDVVEAASGEEGLKVAESIQANVILLDNRMPGMSGMEALQHLRGINPNAMIILMTAYSTTQTTIQAMKYGAFDYIMKPFDMKKILSIVENAIDASTDLDKARQGESDPATLSMEDLEGGIIGISSVMQDVFKMIGQVAASDVSVMITGESGTGKELIARAIFQHSLRSKAPFVAVNCAAIPENLIESELFGHEKGSFTGATTQRKGKFELCDGGTIFLDEIGDMALATQTKILRALQEGEIQRVGGTETIKVNVRMLAATNKSLETMVEDKTFREDLYYRLNVVRIHVPPLRERGGDVPHLINFVLKRLANEKKAAPKAISPEALEILCAYKWPGNVRELENLIYRSAVIAQGDTILTKDLPHSILDPTDRGTRPPTVAPAPAKVSETELEVLPGEPASAPAAFVSPSASTAGLGLEEAFDLVYRKLRASHGENLLEPVERETILRTLKETNGNQVQASKILGITRATLRKRIDQYDLKV